jgi:diguanylate cyclase (GGDEF)-like protein/PAS domain S-box-containing protein
MASKQTSPVSIDTIDPRSVVRVVWPLLAALAIVLAVAIFSIEMLSTIRAYVGGESQYSKGQKNATYYLTQYAASHAESDFQRYLLAVAAPLGDRRARLALVEDPPDLDSARAGFVAGGNDPADVPSMIWMFRWFASVEPMKTAIDIWTRGDAYSLRISTLAERLHQTGAGAALSADEGNSILSELRTINEQLTTLEGQFSSTLNEAARFTRTALASAMAIGTLILAFLAIHITRRRLRDRVEYQEALQASEDRYRSVFEGSMDAVLITLPNGHILEANPEACRLFGYSPAEIAQLGRAAIVDERSEALSLALAQRQRTGRFKSHLQFRRKDGRTFTGEACLATFTDRNGETRISTVIRDITGQQRYERGLARLTALYAAQSQTSQLILRVSHQRLLFEELCRICVNAGGLGLATVGLINADSRAVQFAASHGSARQFLDGLVVPIDLHVPTDLESASAALADGEPQVRSDILFTLGKPALDTPDAGRSFHSCAALPLRCMSKVIGVLAVFSTEPQFFDRDIIDLLRQIAGEVSFALDNIRRDEERQQRETLLADENRLLNLVATGADLNVVLKTLAKLLESQSGAAVCTVIVLDQKGTHYSAGAASSPAANDFDNAVMRVKLEDAAGPSAEAMRGRSQVTVENLDSYALDAPLREFVREGGLHTARAWPIVGVRDTVLGALALYGGTAGTLPEVDDEVMRICTDLAGIAIENRSATERIEHLAHHDELTGLPNRILNRQYLARALARARRNRTRVGVLFLDLDRFKIINDSLGHSAGDKVLCEVAERLRANLREADTLARVGGDEFTVLIEGFDNPKSLGDIAQKLLTSAGRVVLVNGRECHVSCSIGIAIYPDDAGEGAVLLKNADTAMYRAKAAGRDSFQFYSKEMNERSVEIQAVEAELREALKRREFEVHYQPKQDVKSGRLVGAEALVRWRHPVRGLVAPLEFVHIAEDAGLIGAIGRLVLETVCTDVARWRETGMTPFRVGINVSAQECADPRFVRDVDRILREKGVDPGWIEFEMAENVVIPSLEKAREVLVQIKQRGITLAIDDFGTAHSSLAHLRRLLADTLKIDRAFISGLGIDEDALATTRASIALGHALGLTVLAEGVETPAQLEILRRHGCDEFQGFLFSRPVPADEFEELLARAAHPPRNSRQA